MDACWFNQGCSFVLSPQRRNIRVTISHTSTYIGLFELQQQGSGSVPRRIVIWYGKTRQQTNGYTLSNGIVHFSRSYRVGYYIVNAFSGLHRDVPVEQGKCSERLPFHL